jgi:hypothetical protein
LRVLRVSHLRARTTTTAAGPCDRHDLRLRDRVGAEFPVKADAGCRNTVFNNRAQTGAEYVTRLLALGARAFRVEFLNETPDELVRCSFCRTVWREFAISSWAARRDHRRRSSGAS